MTSRVYWHARRPEVWLDLDHAAAAALQARLGTVEAAHTECSYYDTPDLALRRAGVRLSIERHGRHAVQRVTIARGGRHEQLVHETAVPDRVPDRAHLAVVLPANVAAALAVARFEHLFALRYTRSMARFPKQHPLLMAVVDRGTLAVAGTETAFAELSLTDLGGNHAGAAAAVELLGDLPVRLAAEDRWERGFRIAAGVQVHSTKGGAVRVEAGATVGEAARIVLRNAFEHFLRNLPAASIYGDVEAVHQMRVGLRRLRA